jgi:rhodanese-related sulfurtransferase
MSDQPARRSRRTFVLAGGTALAVAGFAGLNWYRGQRGADGLWLTVAEAHAGARAGEVLLIDIRRPEEWAQTGLGEGAIPLDMRRRDFLPALQALMTDRPGARVALICATGGRSRYLAGQLEKAGLTGVYDVPEGMLGSRAGPGWLRTGLPVRQPQT